MLPGFLAVLVMACGWFYLFYSRAAQRLAAIEQEQLNQRRVRLRRLGGCMMFLLGLGIAFGSYGVDYRRPKAFLIVWLGVCALLAIVVLLAMTDLRLTWRLRHPPAQPPPDSTPH